MRAPIGVRVDDGVVDRHFTRKHGADAYYGQR